MEYYIQKTNPLENLLQDKDNECGESAMSASAEIRPVGVRPPLTRVVSNIPCVVITHKPIEKILIWFVFCRQLLHVVFISQINTRRYSFVDILL